MTFVLNCHQYDSFISFALICSKMFPALIYEFNAFSLSPRVNDIFGFRVFSSIFENLINIHKYVNALFNQNQILRNANVVALL